MDTLYLVVPCYNEEAVLAETSKQLLQKMNSMISEKIISEKSRIVFVNDGSKDSTLEILCELHNQYDLISCINLSRNRGHQNALLAGLMTVKEHADMVISLDADLQDDINVIDKFVEKYYQGFDIVYGVRSSREKDTFFKKFTAEGFYKVMKALGGEIVFNHADYRLMSKRALNGLEEFNEVNLFLRGVVPLIGYKSAIVEYVRHERFAGESKYPLKKMLSFAFEGITSLSVKPIKMITSLGISISFISLLFLIVILLTHFIGHTVIGWTSLIASVLLLGGLQLLAIGIVGEYIGKVYLETKARPKFIIQEFLNKK